MIISRLRQLLTTPIDEVGDRSKRSTSILLWLSLSLGFALYYGSLGLQKAFRAEYVVQDDAREYVFWMQQFVDPTLFPHDLIADYFKSITPPGYAAIYHLMANLGIQPLLLSKILPIVIGVVTTLYGFRVCLKLFPIPMTGFIAMLLLNQSLWFRDDLSSATPRAFVYPLFLAFLYYLLHHIRLGVMITIVLQALIYPPLVLITIAVLFLRLWNWDHWHLHRERIPDFVFAAGLGFLALLPYAFLSAEFNPIVTKAEALTMPELYPGGRHPYFDPNLWRFWLTGQHSGILPPLLPPLIWVGLGLPIVAQNLSRFPLIKRLNREVVVLAQTALASLGLFLAAHALLLKLFFPTRYTTHTWRIVLAIAAAIVLTVLLDAVLLKCEELARADRWKPLFWRLTLTGLIGALLILFPSFSPSFPATNYRISGEGALYQFLHKQPQDSLVATLSDEANSIPTFARRSVLIGKEYALPFHLGYYRQIRQRSIELIQAQYSPDLALVQQLIEKYGIDFWLLDRTAFTPEYLLNKSWLQSFQPAFNEASTRLQQGKISALSSRVNECVAFESQSLTLLKATCITQRKTQVRLPE
ncbi:hypothetical protein C7B65_11305 [Phormidesmis priestleyi ULC007]|uniref:Glycosyltransferase RgtA/B/C/D-like domain-containing protein n=1 Tax=Phormidesmis priestleyi ULC007 TaxID=1920490 RepID=A0A2T1DGB3_9CYAN|nr:hypothetical protein [Phormidesmis priestleyi]PSB19497.1 hypothetical protein C7B65_11305 [Phormidesmis priestleyi ULC007]PZO53063.1 MAG: hypothetical protein DCF14_05450 [Phormidesmis priestleyi]